AWRPPHRKLLGRNLLLPPLVGPRDLDEYTHRHLEESHVAVRDMVRVSRRGVAIAALALPLAVAATVGTGTATASPAGAGRVHISDTTLTSTSQKVTISIKLGL